MKVVAIKDMSAGNETVGEAWQETKIFDANESILQVMRWVKSTKKKVTLSIPEDDQVEFFEAL